MCWTIKELFNCCCKMSTLAMGHTYPAVVCVLGVFVGASGRIMDHTSTSGAKTKGVWSYTSTPVSCHGMHKTTVLLHKSFNSLKFKIS